MPPSSSKAQTSASPATIRSPKEPWKLRAPPSPERRSPLIVHMEPARVIHANPQEFMGLVQRLTGKSSPGNDPPHAEPTPASSPVACRSVPDINVAYEAEDDESDEFCQ